MIDHQQALDRLRSQIAKVVDEPAHTVMALKDNEPIDNETVRKRGTPVCPKTDAILAAVAGEMERVRNAGLDEAAEAVLRATEIPHDAKEPNRDWLVVWGEQMADRIRSLQAAARGEDK